MSSVTADPRVRIRIAPCTEPELTFFDSLLRLRRQILDRSAEPPGDAAAARSLAAFLLTPPPGTARPSSFQALHSPELRWRRAQILLAELEHAERTAAPDAAGLWPEVEAEWRWVAQAPLVRDRLLAHARELGVGDSEAGVTATLEGLTTELLPGLHLKWLMVSRVSDPRNPAEEAHWYALAAWSIRADASPGSVVLYHWYMLALLAVGRELPPNAMGILETLLRTRGPGADLALDSVVFAFASARKEQALQRFGSGSDGLWWFEQKLPLVERVAYAGAQRMELLELISLMRLGAGMGRLRSPSTFAAGILDLAQAAVLDPTNEGARSRLDFAVQMPELLRQEHEGRARKRRASPGTLIKITGYAQGVQRALSYLENEATPLRRRRREATVGAVIRRLELDGSDAEQVQAIETLLDVLDAVADEPGSTPDGYVTRVRSAALERDPTLHRLPWDRIDRALRRHVLPGGDFLPHALPAPASQTFEEVATRVRDAAASNVEVFPVRRLRDRAADWLFARRDYGYKTAALCGVLLIFLSLGLRITGERRYARLERAYGEVEAGVRAANDSVTVGGALAFLRLDPNPQTDDRVPHVGEWLREALLRRVVALTEGGRAEEAKLLLESYRQLQER